MFKGTRKVRTATQIIVVAAHKRKLYVSTSDSFKKSAWFEAADWNPPEADQSVRCAEALQIMFPALQLEATYLGHFETVAEYIRTYHLQVHTYFVELPEQLPAPVWKEGALLMPGELYSHRQPLTSVLPDEYKLAIAA